MINTTFTHSFPLYTAFPLLPEPFVLVLTNTFMAMRVPRDCQLKTQYYIRN